MKAKISKWLLVLLFLGGSVGFMSVSHAQYCEDTTPRI
jgi:hypothetical protein